MSHILLWLTGWLRSTDVFRRSNKLDMWLAGKISGKKWVERLIFVFFTDKPILIHKKSLQKICTTFVKCSYMILGTVLGNPYTCILKINFIFWQWEWRNELLTSSLTLTLQLASRRSRTISILPWEATWIAQQLCWNVREKISWETVLPV